MSALPAVWRPGGPGGERAQQVQVSRAGNRRMEGRFRRATRVGPASAALGTLAVLGGEDRPGRWRRVLAAWHDGCARMLAEEPLDRREIRAAAARRSPLIRRSRRCACLALCSELHPDERALLPRHGSAPSSSCACGRPHPFAAAARLWHRARETEAGSAEFGWQQACFVFAAVPRGLNGGGLPLRQSGAVAAAPVGPAERSSPQAFGSRGDPSSQGV